MNAIWVVVLHVLFVIHPFRQRLDFGESVGKTVDDFHGLSFCLLRDPKGLFQITRVLEESSL
jgi:hypothetical protein